MVLSPFPGFHSDPPRPLSGRSVSQTAAVGVAALTLASGAAAEAMPMQTVTEAQAPSWTLAEAVANAPIAAAISAPTPVPAASVATMAPVSGRLSPLMPTTARWAGVVGQIQPHVSSPAASAQCCFSDGAKPVRFRRQSPNALQPVVQNETAMDTHQFYLLLILMLWFGATAPWILRQFWLSQQRMSYGRYGYGARRSRSRARSHSKTSLYKSQRYRAIALNTSRVKASRFAKPRVAVAAQAWGDEWVYTPLHGTEELIYEPLPGVLATQASAEQSSADSSETRSVTVLTPVAI